MRCVSDGLGTEERQLFLVFPIARTAFCT